MLFGYGWLKTPIFTEQKSDTLVAAIDLATGYCFIPRKIKSKNKVDELTKK